MFNNSKYLFMSHKTSILNREKREKPSLNNGEFTIPVLKSKTFPLKYSNVFHGQSSHVIIYVVLSFICLINVYIFFRMYSMCVCVCVNHVRSLESTCPGRIVLEKYYH